MAKKNTSNQALLSGNEALAHGAWGAGLSVACAYPGTPSTEILETLADLGCACALKDVLATSVPDQPGNFHKLSSELAANETNILDACGFVLQPHQIGICCMEIDKLQMVRAAEVVQQARFAVLEDEELDNL